MKHIDIKRAKSLEESIKLFTSETSKIHDVPEWELHTVEGDKHPQSTEFVEAVKTLKKSFGTIHSILNSL